MEWCDNSKQLTTITAWGGCIQAIPCSAVTTMGYAHIQNRSHILVSSITSYLSSEEWDYCCVYSTLFGVTDCISRWTKSMSDVTFFLTKRTSTTLQLQSPGAVIATDDSYVLDRQCGWYKVLLRGSILVVYCKGPFELISVCYFSCLLFI